MVRRYGLQPDSNLRSLMSRPVALIALSLALAGCSGLPPELGGPEKPVSAQDIAACKGNAPVIVSATSDWMLQKGMKPVGQYGRAEPVDCKRVNASAAKAAPAAAKP